MKTRCLIVDDEPIAIKVIQSHLAKVPDVEVVATCMNALEAFEIVRKQAVDLIFLDIQMPELTGLDFVKALEHPPRVIFTTAYREFALEGFEVDAVDYLLKPVSLPRLLRAVDKYRRLRDAGAGEDPQAAPTPGQYLTVRVDRQTLQIRLDDIRYIESLSDYVKIHVQGRAVVSKERISRLADRLAAYGFMRIHRSFLVPVAGVTSFTADEVHVGSQALPIGRTYKQAVLERMRGRGV
jgi:DNA-binding LytR/AlgR family response regulator